MFFYEQHNLDNQAPYSIFKARDLTWGIHFHRAYECLFVLSGNIECTVESQTYSLQENSAVFIMTNQLHSYLTKDNSQVLILRFTPELVGHFFTTYKELIPDNNMFVYENASILHSIPEHFDNPYKLKALLYDICGSFTAQTLFHSKTASSEDTLILQLIHYIEENFTKDCSLKSASKQLGFDYYYISKYFMQYTGTSFTNYINHRRIAMACDMLKTSDAPFVQIAFACGFGSLRSFNRNFAKYCGCTPSEYQNSL